MSKSRIEWTTDTWNPTTGCTPVSAGCDHCYAERLARRLQATGMPKYRRGFEYTEHDSALELPRHWRGRRVVFVNSMSDLFHEHATKRFIQRVFDTMLATPQHVYQVLTKRPNKAAAWVREICDIQELDYLPDHIWIGTSVESAEVLWRIDHLRRVPAQTRFLSCEPLLGPLDGIELDRVHWVIAGGESGPQARPMDLAWARQLRDRCHRAGVPFFLKQLGGWPHKRGGDHALLDGNLWREMPTPKPVLPAARPQQLVTSEDVVGDFHRGLIVAG
jgi:protein gp37